MCAAAANPLQPAPDTSPVSVSARELINLARVARGLDLARFREASTGGDHLSRLLGRGMEFDEARPYQPGDDPRNIDWRVTARTGRPYTKVFREERERPVLLVTDLRRSMRFATRGVFKSVQAARLAGILAWAAMFGGDRVGGFLFAEQYHREIKPLTGRRGVLTLIYELCRAPVWTPDAAAGGDPAAAALRALRGVRKVSRSGSLVFILTDGHDLDATAITTLRDLCGSHDVVLLHIYDALEQVLPPPGRYLWKTATSQARALAASRSEAEQHRAAFAARADALRAAVARGRSHYVAISTSDNPVARLTELYAAQR